MDVATVTQIQEAQEPTEAPLGWPEFVAWLGRHRVTLGAVGLITVQSWWKAVTLSHAYFQQDDLVIGGQASHSLNAHYLFQVYAGHLQPGAFALAWALVHLSGYDWGLWAGTLLAIQVLAGFVLLRALRTLFGDRPLILVPLAVYLFTPMTVPALTWWSGGVQSVALQLAIPLAVDQHVRYVRDGRLRHAVFATAGMLFGLAFFEKAVAIPVLLFALTSAFLVAGGWPSAMAASLRRYWPAWVMYAGTIIVEIVLYDTQLHTSAVTPHMPRAGDAAVFGWQLFRDTFVPAALGGPWGWTSDSPLYAHALPPVLPLRLSWLAAVLIVAASLWYRRNAWRAWAILLGWLMVVDIVPVALGRVWVFGVVLARETLYVADAAPVLAICVAFAFLPLSGEERAYRARLPSGRPRAVLGGALAVASMFGSFWSVNAYNHHLHPANTRSYLATVSAALGAVSAHTVIYPSLLPDEIVWSLFGSSADTAHALAPLANRVADKHLQWTSWPDGTPNNFMIFDNDGRLHGAIVVGPHSFPHPHGCWFPAAKEITIPLDANMYPGKWLLQIGYFAPRATRLEVGFGGRQSEVTLAASPLAYGYLPVNGPGNAVVIKALSANPHICIGGVVVGTVQEYPPAAPIPAFPVRG
jgi:hypothetical protein